MIPESKEVDNTSSNTQQGNKEVKETRHGSHCYKQLLKIQKKMFY